MGIRAVAIGSEKIGKKIREAQLEKTPYMLIVGDREAEAGTVAVRTHLAATKARHGPAGS